MRSTMFRLASLNNQDTIIMPATGMRISIYNLESENFIPNPEKLQFYADGIFQLAFEVDTNPDGRTLNISAALKWYADHLGTPEMDITTENPIPAARMRLVR